MTWLALQEIFSALGVIVVCAVGIQLWRLWTQGKGKAFVALGAASALAGFIHITGIEVLPEIQGSHRLGVIPFAVLIWILSAINRKWNTRRKK